VDELPLALVELAGLPEDLVRHRDLAEVVQLRRARELLELVGGQGEPLPDVERESGDTLEVRMQRRLLGRERLDERIHALARAASASLLLGVEPLVGQAEGGADVARL